MGLIDEIFEQPDCLERLLIGQRDVVEKIAREIHCRNIQYVLLAARGTSDNAGRYANYIWSLQNQLPVALAAPSQFTYYEQPPRLKNALVVGISQSGQSPDIVSVLAEGKRQGCLTLAITNSPASPLAQAADYIIDLMAGPELAVAATKTYTTELMAIAMLAAGLAGQKNLWDALAQVPEWLRETLAQNVLVEQAVQRYRYMQQCVVLGRGYNYATAFEWALKLKELTYILAEPYSSADFQHGPVAMITDGFPVLAIVAKGKVQDSMLTCLTHLRKDLQAELVVVSNCAQANELAQVALAIPAGVPEWLSPLVGIVPGQLFAHHLTVAKGHNPDVPRTIQKVTETR